MKNDRHAFARRPPYTAIEDDIILQDFDNLDEYDLEKTGQFMEVFSK